MKLTPRLTLKVAIIRSGRLQRDMAPAMGMTPSHLSQIITGRINPTDDEERAIARVLRQPREALFDYESVAS